MIARWTLYASVIGLACVIAGAGAFIVLHTAPSGPTFAWPFRLAARTNVLVMGLDRTVSDQNPNIVYSISRTDTLIAASFDPASRSVYFVSVPRDSRVPVPGHGFDKITNAHAYGGSALTLRTAEDFLGVRFPYYIEITERGLVHLIDAVGGVTVRIDKDLNYDDNWDGLHIHLKKGNRRLGGKAAMEFARFRHDPLGDIGRVGRQQQMMNALVDELRKPRILFRVPRILKVFREDITTNLKPDQLVALAWFGARLPRGALARDTLPGRFGGYAGYWLPDASQDRELIAREFYGIDAAILAGTTIDVINANTSRDAVTDPLARLAALGVRVVRVTVAPDAAETSVVMHGGDPRVGKIVASALGVDHLFTAGTGSGSDMTLVLGKDYAFTATATPAASPAPPPPPVRRAPSHRAAPQTRAAPTDTSH
jgi:polyisoprenyl-teichoic acid--peptidoglycan teichoic acid transferase